MFKVSPASVQTFVDTPNRVLEERVQYSTVHISNVFCDGHLQIISCVYCNRQVQRDFLITLYILFTCICKKMKLKFTLVQAPKALTGTKVIALLFLQPRR